MNFIKNSYEKVYQLLLSDLENLTLLYESNYEDMQRISKIIKKYETYARLHIKYVYHWCLGGVFMQVYHEFPPVFDENSKILLLGSIPSVKSREEGFYYMHPKNRFWKVLENVFQEKILVRSL